MGTDSETGPENIEAVVSGKVTETGSDVPIGGADVAVFRPDEDQRLGQATTDSNGSYEVAFTVPGDDAPGQLAIEMDAEGFTAKTDTMGFDPSLTRDVSLEAMRFLWKRECNPVGPRRRKRRNALQGSRV
jgi:hypothetical protein